MKLGPEKLKFINEKDDEKDLKDESKLDGSETPEMQLCFKNLQAFSACFDAFAHGGNDVGWVIAQIQDFALISIEQYDDS